MSEDAPDTAASALITAHAFQSSHWWERCAICGYSMAAHTTLTEPMRIERAESLGAHDHRCPECVLLDHDRVFSDGTSHRVHTDCPHRWEG
jgi:hypothetical protein